MHTPIIELSHVNKTYDVHHREEGFLASLKSLFHREYKTVTAVDDINLSINRGEIRGLLGPNGAGKSTTIKMLSGILHPSSGDVSVMGMVPWKERERYVRNLGVVFGQKSQLWWDLPAADTFGLQKEMYRIPTAAFRERLDYFSHMLDIEEVIRKPVRQLSLGERMKCELVCAMLHEPPLIFLDEPTIGLDVLSKETIRRFIKQVNREKQTTFIITTHDLSDVEDLCEKVTIINKGSVVFDDTLEKLRVFFSHKKIVDVQFERPVTESELSDFEVVSFNPRMATIEFTLSDADTIRAKLTRILDRLPVQDINVNNIRIEEVIKQIYLA